MDKSADAFRTISEVAADLDLPQHVLRFWETRFAQIKPLKRGGGRRYYRPDDVELLKGIRHLLYGEGYTIRGVQRILKEQGVRFVMNVWLEGAPQPPKAGGRWYEPAFADPVDPAAPASAEAWEPDWSETAEETAVEDPAVAAPLDEAADFDLGAGDEAAARAMARRFAPRLEPASEPLSVPRSEPASHDTAPGSVATPAARVEPSLAAGPLAAPRPVVPASERRFAPPAPEPARGGLGQIFDRLRPSNPPADHGGSAGASAGHGLGRDEIRRLQSTLFELLECKRLLDQVR